MKTEVKKIDSTQREINVEVGGEVVKNKFEDIFQKISKEAKVPGFRPGHAPRDVLEKHYSSFAHEQVIKELVPDIYNQAIDKEGLDVIDLPQISDVKLDRNNLSFKAKIEISPEFEVKNYKGIKVEYKNITVSSEEIKRNIDSLKERMNVKNLDDALAKGLGYPNVSELEKAIEKQIFLQKDNHQRQIIENHIIDSLTKDLNFKLPPPLVSRQLKELMRQAKVDMALKGLPKDKIDEHDELLSKELKPQAEKQVRIYLVLAQIAKKEKIAIDDNMPHEIMQLLLKEASWSTV